jgi:5'-nucleotidase
MSPRALITNDDGVSSAGIACLAAAVLDAGYETIIAAPTWDSSGSSSALTAVEHDGQMLFDQRTIDGLDIDVFGVEAAPAYIVRAALTGAFGKPPELVCSGINLGANTGHVILHSGTVGAVLTAATYGVPGLAVSLSRGNRWHLDTADLAVRQVLPIFAEALPLGAVNLNVPGVEPEGLRGIRTARLAHLGAVQSSVTEAGSGWVSLSFEPTDGDHVAGTDNALLDLGYATLTALSPVCEAPGVDLDQYLNALDLDARAGDGPN